MLLFSFDYPPNDGGISRLCSEIVQGLVSRQHEVTVLTQQFDEVELPDIHKLASTTKVIFKRPQRELQALVHFRTTPNLNICVSSIWYPEGLLAQVSNFKHRVILAHSAELYPPTQKWRQPLWRYLQRIVLEKADVVIANSHFTANFVKQVAPKACVVPVLLAVDHEQFQPQNRKDSRARWQVDENQRVICTVSRVHHFKGHETVFEAIANLPKRIREHFVYLVGGKGTALEFLKSRAVQLGIDQQIRWLGFVDDKDLSSLYSASDLFVLATREIPGERLVEGFGLAFLEAQACGVPAVGTNTGGIPDAISHGDGGWLIEQDDAQDLTRIFIELYNKPDDFRLMGNKARERIEREFTLEHYINRFIMALTEGGISLD